MNDYGIAPSGYRLPDDLRLGPVTLAVSDIDRSLDFYSGLLGMQVLSHDADSVRLGALSGTAGSDVEALLVLRPDAQPRRGGWPAGRRRLGLYHFAVLLPDRPALGRLFSRLLEHGVQPGAADHLVSEALYLQDPDDLGIELYHDRPRSEWSARGRQVAMSSDPLDVRGLLAAGAGDAGATWTGMPAGTRIGHVHLHVRDIELARAFYHDALGFDLIAWNYPGALFMSAGGYHHHVGVNTWAGPGAETPGDDEPRLLGWDIVLPSAADVVTATASLAQYGHFVSPDGVVRDPWGTPLRVRPEG